MKIVSHGFSSSIVACSFLKIDLTHNKQTASSSGVGRWPSAVMAGYGGAVGEC